MNMMAHFNSESKLKRHMKRHNFDSESSAWYMASWPTELLYNNGTEDDAN